MSRALNPALTALLVFGLPACDGDGGGDDAAEAGTGDETGETGDTGGGLPSHLPASNSADDMRAFIEAQTYRGERWTAETDAPRPEFSSVSPHDNVRVWLNDEAVASQAAGNGMVGGTPHDLHTAAVKEIYDGDTLVGAAMLFRTEEGDALDATSYWCYGPEGRCATMAGAYTADAPLYGQGIDVDCGGCHGGTIFTELP